LYFKFSISVERANVAGGVARVVECLPSKDKAPSSNPSTPRKEKRKEPTLAKHRWLTPIILATQEAEIRRILVPSQSWQTVSEKTHHKKGLVEWLKVKALSSNTSTTKKKKKFKQRDRPPDKPR
jgi:hypothetical protein